MGSVISNIKQKLKTNKEKLEGSEKSVSTVSKNVSSSYLKLEMGNSKTEKIITVKNQPATCKNCKNNPCLDDKPVTPENFMKEASAYWAKWDDFRTLTRKRDDHIYFKDDRDRESFPWNNEFHPEYGIVEW